jgi:hypothetical protein
MRHYIDSMSNADRPDGAPEQPRYEPEILPPERSGHRQQRREEAFIFINQSAGSQRVPFGAPGLFSFAFAFVLGGLLLAGILLLAFGIVVVLVPAIAIIVAALLSYLYLRAYWRRLQGRYSR